MDDRTIKTSDGKTIRLIGCDTPETVELRKPEQAFGKEASDFMKKLVIGKRAKLTFDQQRTDKYGRMLAYLYLEDGTCVNAELIRQGYAAAYARFPCQYMEQFRQYEREARENRRGLWAETASAAIPPPQKVAPNPVIHH